MIQLPGDKTASVFLISLKAGGFGLNLAEADYCFVLDPWWNPATEAQAVDRTHRIGQTKTVMVYRLVAKDTIEQKVMDLKRRKNELFESVVGGEALAAAALSAEEIRGFSGVAMCGSVMTLCSRSQRGACLPRQPRSSECPLFDMSRSDNWPSGGRHILALSLISCCVRSWLANK